MPVHATHQESMQAPVPGRGFLPAAEMAKRQASARIIHDGSSRIGESRCETGRLAEGLSQQRIGNCSSSDHE
jgi:hypothetical protein